MLSKDNAVISPVTWYCEQADHSDMQLCRRAAMRKALLSTRDPAERKRILEAFRSDDRSSEPSQRIQQIREEGKKIIDAFCKEPAHSQNARCTSSAGTHSGRRVPAFGGLPMTEVAQHLDGLRQMPGSRNDMERWWCKAHPAAAEHSAEPLCQLWEVKDALRNTTDREARKTAFDRLKEVHMKLKDKLHSIVTARETVMTAFCQEDAHKALPLCVSHASRKSHKSAG